MGKKHLEKVFGHDFLRFSFLPPFGRHCDDGHHYLSALCLRRRNTNYKEQGPLIRDKGTFERYIGYRLMDLLYEPKKCLVNSQFVIFCWKVVWITCMAIPTEKHKLRSNEAFSRVPEGDPLTDIQCIPRKRALLGAPWSNCDLMMMLMIAITRENREGGKASTNNAWSRLTCNWAKKTMARLEFEEATTE